MWGYGIDLQRAHRLLRVALACLVLLLGVNGIGLVQAIGHHGTSRLVVAALRVVANALILVLGIKGAHALSILAERASVYRGVIERGLPQPRRNEEPAPSAQQSELDAGGRQAPSQVA